MYVQIGSEQTLYTLIRLLLKEQSDQGLHCLLFHLHLLDKLLYGKAKLFLLHDNYSYCFRYPSFQNVYEMVFFFYREKEIQNILLVSLQQALLSTKIKQKLATISGEYIIEMKFGTWEK